MHEEGETNRKEKKKRVKIMERKALTWIKKHVHKRQKKKKNTNTKWKKEICSEYRHRNK